MTQMTDKSDDARELLRDLLGVLTFMSEEVSAETFRHCCKPYIARITARLAEPAPEPVARRWKNTNGPWQLELIRERIPARFAKEIQPLYALPPLPKEPK